MKRKGKTGLPNEQKQGRSFQVESQGKKVSRSGFTRIEPPKAKALSGRSWKVQRKATVRNLTFEGM